MARFAGDDRPPPGWRRIAEALWLLPRLLRGFGKVSVLGPEDGPPAFVIPGFAATDKTCAQLRRSLAEAGWRTYPWDLGFNRGAGPDTIRRLRQRLEVIHDGRPVLVVGWSLGGVYARELAREVPQLVRAVVTLGSPFSGDPRMNNVWRLYEWVAGHKVDDPPVPHYPDKPPVPHLALWSRKDGIIAPRAARGLDGERDKEVEMACSHMAFGVSRKATRRAAREIALFLEEVEGKPPLESRD
ncbi:MAG TPA: alpha/beta fold hydrolase [Sphingomicrobium sp.]|nr:alpha/beta fold hydrolase [Sphingomicrobium sp.]